MERKVFVECMFTECKDRFQSCCYSINVIAFYCTETVYQEEGKNLLIWEINNILLCILNVL